MQRTERLDPILSFLVFLFSAFGLVMITSASMGIATHFYHDSLFFAKRHLLNLALGLLLFSQLLKVPVHTLRRTLPLFYLLTLLLLIAVFLPHLGEERNGAHRWIHLGPFLFQPSEGAKLFLVLYLASKLSRRRISTFSELIATLLIPAPLFLLILVEPNFSTAILLFTLTLSILFVGNCPLHLLGKLLVLAALGASLLIFSSHYRSKRLLGFLSPNKHRQSINYQTYQSLLAIGSGSWIGEGLGAGKQKFFYLPQPHTDFIFAVLAEELGFAGATGLLLLYLLFAARVFTLLHRVADPFCRFLAFGLTLWLLLQTFLHVAVTLQLGPATGVPLPFISYGGSSTLANLAAAAICIRSLYDGKSRGEKKRHEENLDRYWRDRGTPLSRALP